MLSKKAIRIIAIVLAALMVLSVGAVLFQVFGVSEAVSPIPQTGEGKLIYIIPAVVIVVALIAIVCALVIPKVRKAKQISEETQDKGTQIEGAQDETEE